MECWVPRHTSASLLSSASLSSLYEVHQFEPLICQGVTYSSYDFPCLGFVVSAEPEDLDSKLQKPGEGKESVTSRGVYKWRYLLGLALIAPATLPDIRKWAHIVVGFYFDVLLR